MDGIIYIICLTVGLLFTIISAIAGHLFGGDHGGDIGTGGHAEAGFSDSGLPGISFFSPTVLAAFVTAFGAFGLIMKSITDKVWVSAPAAAAGGGLVALLVLWLFNFMFRKTESSSESRVASLVGHCEAVIASGQLPEPSEQSMRLLVAETLSAFGMVSHDQLENELAGVRRCMERS